MKDTSIKGSGKSSIIKAPSDIPTTFDAWREQFLAGEGYLSVRLNTDITGKNAGCNEIGTTLSKANLLNDTTKAALELTQTGPTVNDALCALSQKGSPAKVHVVTDNRVQVTMSKGNKVLIAQVSSDEAISYPAGLGDWSIQYTFNGSQKTRTWTLEVIGVVYVYPFEIGDTTNDTDWEDIDICSRLGMAEKFFKVGDTKTVNTGDVNYEVQIIDFNHDDKVSGGKAPMTFQFVDCLNQTAQMNSNNTNTEGWNGSTMRTKMATCKNQLPAALRNVIKTVKKKSGTGGGSSSGTQTTNDDLFLLSEIEISGMTTYSIVGKGTQYAWYKAGNTRIKKVNGSANSWWERSPYSSGTGNFCYVIGSGDAGYDGADRSRGVSFGFCVQSNIYEIPPRKGWYRRVIISAIESKRGENPMQFIEIARKLEARTFSVVTKTPERYGPHLLYRLMALATTVHDKVRAANNVHPRNQHEARMRRDCLTRANITLQSLSPKLTLLYDAILQSPEKCPQIGRAIQEFGECIEKEAKLIAKVKGVDSERYKDLPV